MFDAIPGSAVPSATPTTPTEPISDTLSARLSSASTAAASVKILTVPVA